MSEIRMFNLNQLDIGVKISGYFMPNDVVRPPDVRAFEHL